jgi:hypothetical protein
VTWKHVTALIGALALPVICGLSPTCSASSFKDVIGLSMIVVAGIMGNANSSTTTTATATPRGATVTEKPPT